MALRDSGSSVGVFRAVQGRGKHRVYAIGVATGTGVIISIVGGEKPHIGAVALAIPRPSLRNPKSISATSSVLTLTGHKDDSIARPLSEKFAKTTRQPAIVIVGIHVRKADQKDIHRLATNAKRVADTLLNKIENCAIEENPTASGTPL